MLKFYNNLSESLFNHICFSVVVLPYHSTYNMKKNYFMLALAALMITAFSCNKTVADNDFQTRIDSLSLKLDSCQIAQQTEEDNKKLVAAMYQELFGDKNIQAADKYIIENYIQHNPLVADGRDALKTALSQWFKNAPKEKIDIQHIAADGDFVYIHTRSIRDNKTLSVIDIFRIEGFKIAEHWDVIQEVPANAANAHPMF